MSKNKIIAMKRISRDISEMSKVPIKGIGIVQFEDDILKYIVNIKILTGIYEGYCLQLLLTFSEYYPVKPPKLQIFPGQNFNQTFHHHIFDDKDGFKKFCFDFLENDFMNINEANLGWNPSYTISTLLLQVQNFLSFPDIPKEHLPNDAQIKFLLDSMKNYERIFKDENGNEIIHSWNNPFPPMFGYENKENKENEQEEEMKNEIKEEKEKDIIETDDNSINSKDEENLNNIINFIEEKICKNEEKKTKDNVEEIKQNLTCFLLRVNILDDKDIALGYPLKQLKTLGDKIECVPIPEILSYEGYISQIAKQDGKLDDYFNVTFKAANNECYNYWLPIYINEEHFKRNKTLILNSFSVLKYGAKGQKEYDFKPEHIFEYLPNLLNKMICGMFNQKSFMSEAYLRCYFQYLLLFKKLIDEFKDDFDKYLNNIIKNIKINKYEVNKKIVPDLGNLFMLLFFSDIDLDKRLWNILFEEKMTRKMYWTFHFSENEKKCKELFEEYFKEDNKEINTKILDILKTENLFYYEYLAEIKDENKYQPCKEECLLSLQNKNIEKVENLKPLKGFFSECIEKNIFENIIEIISKEILNKPKKLNDLFSKPKSKKTKVNEKTKKEIKLRIMHEFPLIYKNECSSKAQKKIDQLLINNNIDLLKFCSYELKENKNLKKLDYFENNEVNELMKKIDKKYHSEIAKKLYDTSRGNLLLVTTLAQKKTYEPGFLKKLEKNYGIFLNIEDFMREINTKIKEIQCYKDLFNFMKADIIDEKEDEFQKIIKCYEKAKEKRYIKAPIKNTVIIKGINFEKNNEKNKNKNNNFNFRNIDRRNRRANNNYRNNWTQNNQNNEININISNNNNGRRRNNFNSHFVDLDTFLND